MTLRSMTGFGRARGPVGQGWSAEIVAGSSATRTPATTTSPAVGSSSPARQRSNVDFPQPDGPITTSTSPRASVRSMPRRTGWAPNRFSRPRTVTSGALSDAPPSAASLLYRVDHALGDADTAIAYVKRLGDAGVDNVMCLIQMGTLGRR